jgi:hypothetical protein
MLKLEIIMHPKEFIHLMADFSITSKPLPEHQFELSRTPNGALNPEIRFEKHAHN